MAVWVPISGTVPQYVDANGDPYSGAVLKFYSAGTSSAISLATDSTGGTTAGDAVLNASGYPTVSSNVIIPHLSEDYKWALYATQAAADADSGALITVDSVPFQPVLLGLDGNPLPLDAEGNETITADTDGRIDVAVEGTDVFQLGVGGSKNQFFNFDPHAHSGQASTNFHRTRFGVSSATTIPTGTTNIASNVAIFAPTFSLTGTLTNAATLYISNAPGSGTNKYAMLVDGGDVRIDDNLLLPGQPAFLAYNSADDTGATGNGTAATVDFDTEVFDQGNDFASDTFTAPVTGRYLLATQVKIDGLTAAADSMTLSIVTSNRTYTQVISHANDLAGTETLSMSAVADMDASDTAHVVMTVAGEASDVVAIDGDSSARTHFSGCLLA